ncbi:hypothetical protein [Cumulibacter soli]|uniref:hypothetical protein n=1 Tax=Cumulibacter soli TaxID=2546344 RepID=UPI0010676A64|nr:hypothetical protein [Cumulibacter soli]
MSKTQAKEAALAAIVFVVTAILGVVLLATVGLIGPIELALILLVATGTTVLYVRFRASRRTARATQN